MVVFTLGEAAAHALARVTGHKHPARATAGDRDRVPVRRDSVEAGTFETMFFATPAKGECDAMLRAARDALDAGRRLRREARAQGRAIEGAERAIAALTAGTVRVFEELCALARVNKGRVYPSYDRLAAATALGRATVARALHLLEAAGFLRRQRRFVRVEGEGAGPRYAQTSNAYRPTLPATVRRLLPRWRTASPIPDDAAQHVTTQREALTAMRDGLTCRELAQATVGNALGRALIRLGTALDGGPAGEVGRESHKRPESLTQFYGNGNAGCSSRTRATL